MHDSGDCQVTVQQLPAVKVTEPSTPTSLIIRSIWLVVVMETVEPAELPEAVTAEVRLGSKGEAIFAPLTEKTKPFNPSTLAGAENVTVSLDKVECAIAYQHSSSPPVAETLFLSIHVRPAVSEIENVSPVVSVYSHA